MKRSLLLFFQIFTFLTTSQAQVDEYKMRHEVSLYQFKKQPLGEITQRATIINSETTRIGVENRISDILLHHSGLYQNTSAYDIYAFSYRGSPLTSSRFWLDHVSLGSELLTNGVPIPLFFNPENFDHIEILYGNNAALQTMDNSANIHFRSHDIFNAKDTNKLHISPIIYIGNIAQRIAITSRYRQAAWGNQFQYSYQQNQRYPTADSFFSYPQTSIMQFQNKFQKKIGQYHQLQSFLNLSFSRPMLHIGDYQQNRHHQSEISPYLFSYIQWIQSSDESKWFTQLYASLSYTMATLRDSSYLSFSSRNVNRSHFTSHKIALQSNGYKNLGSRAVFSYGAQFAIETIQSEDDPLSYDQYRFQSPLLHANAYFKKESRLSSDISWHYGGHIALDYLDFQLTRWLFPSSGNIKRWNPSGQLEIQWTRHLCENSNYAIRFSLGYLSPSFMQIKPLISEIYFQENGTLEAEKRALLEGHIYRKWDDQLEVHFSAYYELIKDAIVLRDFYGEHERTIFVGIPIDVVQNQNTAMASRYGGASEVKYHISKSWMAYLNLQCQYMNLHSDQAKYDLRWIPIYGNWGVKYRTSSFFTQLWINYNLGRNRTSPPLTHYEQNNPMNFNSYFTWHLSSSVHILQNIALSLKLDNILNHQTVNYGSTIPNIGRSGSIQLRLDI